MSYIRVKLKQDIYEYIKTHPNVTRDELRNAVWGKPGTIDSELIFELEIEHRIIKKFDPHVATKLRTRYVINEV
jgi:hypothetical protein